MKKILCLFAVASFFIFTSLIAVSQTLDPLFGTAGKAGPFVNGFTPSRYDKAMVLDANGAIIIAGSFGGRFAAMRLNANGTADNTFGTNGIADINKPGVAATAVGLQADGKIILVGHKSTDREFDNADIVVMRLNTNGDVDVTFGSNGVQIIDVSRDDRAFSVLVQSDDKIVIAGYVNNGNDPNNASTDDFIVMRLNSFGSLDASFNSTGYRSIDFAGANDMAWTAAIDANGKILVGGKARVDELTNWDFAIARINSNGTLDNSFSDDGKLTISLTSPNDEIKSIAVQSDGNIVLAGIGNSGINSDYGIVRLVGSNGSLDLSFDGDGKKLIDFNGTQDDAGCVVVNQNGKIIISGNTFNGANDDFGILCLNTDGSIDNGFGNAGKYQVDFSNGYDFGNSMKLLTDGKLLVGNNAGNNTGFYVGIVKLELPVTSCTDADGDGYTTCSGDCDDNNAAVNPDATEICNNNIDDDCDGLMDNADPSVTGQTIWYADADSDGFGNASSTQLACVQPVGYVANAGDCNDNNAAVNPAEIEICGNGVDDDCNANTSDVCAVTPVVSIGDITVTEASGIANLTVSISPVATVPVKISYKTIDGDAQSKMKNKDFKSVGNSSITIPAGTGSAIIPITIIVDNFSETDEQFSVQITKATGAQLGTHSTATVTITESVLSSSAARMQTNNKVPTDKNENELYVQAYPNPSTKTFTLKMTGVDNVRRMIRIINITGQTVKTLQVSGNTIRFGEDLKAGIYFVEVRQGTSCKLIKLVKQ